jgi:putative transposase
MPAHLNRVEIVPVRLSRVQWAIARDARLEAGRLWTRLVRVHRYIRRRRWSWPTETALKAHCKGRFALHSQTVQAIIEKFCANIEATRERRKADKRIRYPYKDKRYFNPIWKGQAMKRSGDRLMLPMGKGRAPLGIRISGGARHEIVQAELGFKDLFITYRVPHEAPASPGEKVAGADPGIVNALALSTGEESLVISGRGIRSIKQQRDKQVAEIQEKISRCEKGSARWRTLMAAKHKVQGRAKRRIRDALHKITRAAVDWCVTAGVGVVALGDPEGAQRHTRRGPSRKRRSRRMAQQLSRWEFGRQAFYLGYKLAAVGVALAPVLEQHTSQTCPCCGRRSKVRGRVYRCRYCVFVAPRDVVGAVNIKNRHLNNGVIVPGDLVPCGNVKYLRPADLRRRSSRPGAGQRCLGGSTRKAGVSSETRGQTPSRRSA